MRLIREQREAVINWVAEGLETPEVNKRAALFDPPFKVSRAQVNFYRHTRKVDIKNLIETGNYDALNSGLAIREERVKRLQLLAAMMEEDLFNGVLWTTDAKMIGFGRWQERIDYEQFNSAEVQQYRGVLDDIAREMGERKQKAELSGPEGKPLIPTELIEKALRKIYGDGSG